MPEDTGLKPTSINELQPKMHLEGTVTRTELYGAFVDLGLERDGLIHISRMDNARVHKVTDKVKVGDKISVWVQSVDPDQGRIALTMVQPPAVDWDELEIGKAFTGRVIRMERYGVFVDIGAERPGLLHIREMGQYVRNPNEVTREGEGIEVRVQAIDRRKRQIDFTLADNENVVEVAEETVSEPSLSPMEIAFMQAQALAQEDNPRRNRRTNTKKRSNRYVEDEDEFDNIYRRTLDTN